MRIYENLFFVLGLVEQLLADPQIRISNFHRQVGREVVHETIAKLRVRIAEHDQLVARDDQ